MLKLQCAFLFTGMISVRDQPVALGCVEGLNFVGFIDEVAQLSVVLKSIYIHSSSPNRIELDIPVIYFCAFLYE